LGIEEFDVKIHSFVKDVIPLNRNHENLVHIIDLIGCHEEFGTGKNLTAVINHEFKFLVS